MQTLTEAAEVQLVEKQILLSIQSTGYASLTLEKRSFKVSVQRILQPEYEAFLGKRARWKRKRVKSPLSQPLRRPDTLAKDFTSFFIIRHGVFNRLPKINANHLPIKEIKQSSGASSMIFQFSSSCLRLLIQLKVNLSLFLIPTKCLRKNLFRLFAAI